MEETAASRNESGLYKKSGGTVFFMLSKQPYTVRPGLPLMTKKYGQLSSSEFFNRKSVSRANFNLRMTRSIFNLSNFQRLLTKQIGSTLTSGSLNITIEASDFILPGS